MAKNKGGRPTVMTEEVIRQLEAAFLVGATDLQACFQAGISKTAFYEYQERNPEFAERKAGLKGHLQLISKHVIADAIKTGRSVPDAKWNLERTDRENYAVRTENTGAGGEPLFPKKIEIEMVSPKKRD